MSIWGKTMLEGGMIGWWEHLRMFLFVHVSTLHFSLSMYAINEDDSAMNIMCHIVKMFCMFSSLPL